MTTTTRPREAGTSTARAPRTSGIRAFAPWRRVWAETGWAAGLGIVAMILGILALRISPTDLGELWTAGSANDNILHAMVATAARDTFFFGPNSHLGFPNSQNLFFAPMLDPFSGIVLTVESLVLPTGVLVLNVYHVLSFFMVGFASYFFFRALGVRRVLVVFFSLVLTLAPFHFQRIGFGHAFVSNYWAVPVVGILILMIAGPATNPFERWVTAGETRAMRLWRRWLPIGVLTLLVSLSLSYYYVFGAIIGGGILFFTGIWSLSTGRGWRPLLWPAVTLASLVVCIGVQLAILSLNFGDRYAKYFSERLAYESEFHGGKITSLLLPWKGTGFGPLARLSTDYASRTTIAPTAEPPGTPIVAALCMVLLVVAAFVLLVRLPSGEPTTRVGRLLAEPRVRVLSTAFLWATLFYTVSGLGAVFAGAVTPELRAWVRMSILMITFALGFGAILLDRLVTRKRVLFPVIAVLAVIAVIDQLSGVAAAVPLKPSAETEYRAFFADAASRLGKDCGVVQLPLKTFPESGPVGDMGDYEEALPYILSDPSSTLRWSYGAVNGTHAGDYWQHIDTPAQFAEKVNESSACAVLVDTYAYVDDADGWQPFVNAVSDGSPVQESTDARHRYLLFTVAR